MSTPQEIRYPPNRYPSQEKESDNEADNEHAGQRRRNHRATVSGQGSDMEQESSRQEPTTDVNTDGEDADTRAFSQSYQNSPASGRSGFHRYTEMLSTPPTSSASPLHRLMQSQATSLQQASSGSPQQDGASQMARSYGSNVDTSGVNDESDTTTGHPRIIRRHLVVSGGGASNTGDDATDTGNESHGEEYTSDALAVASDVGDTDSMNATPTTFSTSHQLQGGAITRDVYKWVENQERNQQRARSRSISDIAVLRRQPSDSPSTSASHLREPGAFRRDFVARQAAERGQQQPNFLTRNFIDFLALYGHFAEDIGVEEALVEEEPNGITTITTTTTTPLIKQPSNEYTPLIRQRRGSRRPGAAATAGVSGSGAPGASVKKAFFLLVKSFVGTGVLFLPKSFYNGGMLFSTFGDIGGALYGPRARYAVLSSIVISQIGFCCAYTIFVAKNLRDLIMLVSDCRWIIPETYLIIGQLAIYIPMALVRKIKQLSNAALVADLFIVFGLAYLYYYDIYVLSTVGMAHIEHFNPTNFTLFIGTAVFTYEGIGLVIPIVEGMQEPEKFPRVLSFTMGLMTLIFVTIGVLSYAAFGEEVETAVQFFYALAILFSVPLQLFPAVGILEAGLFARSGKRDPIVKWRKNMFRIVMASFIGVGAWLGVNNLDRFVSLTGSFACIPLSFIYPSLFHYKAVARTRWQRWSDLALAGFGFVVMFYVTYVTILSWISESTPEPDNNRCIGVP
ncbi:transmembrane amino acid transporter protein-domain-containing protein [Syncephalis plumigaleata]|nr:transmembrane amino acid transporter protein-domain-containing protein [Syncephalis plumigaleata]